LQQAAINRARGNWALLVAGPLYGMAGKLLGVMSG
jgi:hypothetical protein